MKSEAGKGSFTGGSYASTCRLGLVKERQNQQQSMIFRLIMIERFRAYSLRKSAMRSGKAQRWNRAIERYEALVKTGFVRPSDGVRHAQALEAVGLVDAAAQVHRDNVGRFPLEPNVHRQTGLFLLRQHREAEAALSLAKARVLAPTDDVLKADIDRLGIADDRVGAVALAAFYASPAPQPPRPGPLKRFFARRAAARAKMLRQSGDWTKALAAQRTILTNNPGNASAQTRLGHVLKELGDVKNAETAYWRGVALAPKHADSYLQLGHGLKLAHGPKAALPAYLLAQRLQPSHAEAGEGVKQGGLSDHDATRFSDLLATADLEAILGFTETSRPPESQPPGNRKVVPVFRRPRPRAIDVRAAAIAGDIARTVGVNL